MFRRFALGAALSLLALPGLAQTNCTPRLADAELVKPRTLTLSTNPTLPPMQFVNAQGQLVGMRVELGTEIAGRLCLTPEHVRVEFAAMIPGLAARRWDMINTGMFYTEERQKLMYLVRYEEQAISVIIAYEQKQQKDRLDGIDKEVKARAKAGEVLARARRACGLERRAGGGRP
jgi:polar amino acid transport system substrate-binding protein